MDNFHESVLVKEAVNSLHITKGCKYIDATLGNGGHSLEILNLGGYVLGIDMDPEMIRIAKSRIGDKSTFKAVRGNFKDLANFAKKNDWTKIYGILFDLGVSNIHLKDLVRGFSFENENADLDMRLDPENQGVKANDLLNLLRSDQMEELFRVTLEPGPARWLTSRIIEKRVSGPIQTAGEFLKICEGLKTRKQGLHEATLPFLALRIAVNSELENLKEGLNSAFNLLENRGRMVVISFHSKEDEIVKDFFREKSQQGFARIITFKPVLASEDELKTNRRARSARMRVLEKNNEEI